MIMFGYNLKVGYGGNTPSIVVSICKLSKIFNSNQTNRQKKEPCETKKIDSQGNFIVYVAKITARGRASILV